MEKGFSKSKLFLHALFAQYIFFCLTAQAGTVANSFTLDGTVYDSPSGTAPLMDTVTIRVQILNPAKTCVLYDEQQTTNTTPTNGAFSIQVGSATGAAKRTAGVDSNNAMSLVFQNQSVIPGNNGGCTYTPSAGDVRYARVMITPSSTGVTDTLSPDMTVGSMPSALVADTLQGLGLSSFLLVNGSQNLTQANLESLFTGSNYSTLYSVASGGGTSTGGSSAGSYVINSGTGGSGGINFETNGSSKAQIAYNGDFSVGNSNFFIQASSDRVGIGTTSPLASLDLSAKSDALMLPVGTTLQRPSPAYAGMIRFNSVLGKVEVNDGTTWASVGADITGISAGGDLSGTYPNPTVARLQGVAVGTTAPASGQFLKFGTSWSPANVTFGDVKTSGGLGTMGSAVCTAGQTMYYDTSTGDLKCQAIDLSNASITGPLGVAKGGTGVATLTAGSLLLGNGTSAVSGLAAGASGNVIYGTSATAWSVGTPDTAGLVDKASTQTISGTKTFSSVVTGTFQVTGGTPAANKVLTSDASGNATWQSLPSSVGGSGTTGKVPKFTGTSTIGNSQIVDDGTNVGIGSASPTSKLDVSGTLRVADGGEGCSGGTNGGMVKYNGGSLYFCNGSGWQQLGVSGAGLTSLNTLTGSTQTLAIGTTGPSPAWSSSGTTHTLNLPTASASNTGILSSGDWSTFNGKLGTGSVFAGDVTGTYNATVVTKLQGTAIGTTAPVTGQFIKYGASAYAPANMTFGDVKTSGGAAALGSAVCNAGQTMYYDTSTGDLKCQAIDLSNASVTGPLAIANGGTGAATAAQNAVFAGPATGGAGAPSFRALTTADISGLNTYWTSATGGIGYSGGNVGIGTSSPSESLNVYAATGSDSSLSLADGDVAHGMTGVTGTNNYFVVSALSSTKGGAGIGGFSSGPNTSGTSLVGTIGSASPTATVPAVSLVGYKSNGTSRQALASGEMVLGIYNGGAPTPAFGIMGNGRVGLSTTAPAHLLDVNGNIGLAASSYVNFGATDGSSGYGIRDNAGTIEVKSSSGSWSPITAGGVTGSGTTGYLPKFTSSTGLGSSLVYDNGSNVGIGSASPSALLNIYSSGATDPFSVNTAGYGSAIRVDQYANTYFTGGLQATYNGTYSIGALSGGSNHLLLETVTANKHILLMPATGGNVGIGSSAPGAKLDLVSGTANTSGLKLSNLTSASPTGTGQPIGVDASGNVITVAAGTPSQWSNGASSSIYYSSGNVGIATSAPQAKLEIASGDLLIDNGGYLYLKDSSASVGLASGAMEFKTWDTGGGFSFKGSQFGDSYLFINTTGSTRGNVGIGSAAPVHKLDVNGNIGIAASSYLNFGATDGSSGYGIRDNAGVIEVKSSAGSWSPISAGAVSGSGTVGYLPKFSSSTGLASSQLYDDGTNIGIGSAAPDMKLTVVGNVVGNVGLKVKNTSANAGAYSTLGTYSNSYFNEWRTYESGASQIQTNAPYLDINSGIGYLQLDTANVERVRIDANGNVGIGTSVPGTRMEIKSAAANTSGLKFTNFNSATPTGTGQAIGVDASGNVITIASGGSTQWTTVTGGINYSGGNVGIGSSAPNYPLVVNGSALFGTQTSSGSTTPLTVSFGGTYGTNTPGTSGNLKWKMFDSGSAADTYGIGMSAFLMEIRSGAGAGIGLFTNNGSSTMRLTSGGNVGVGSDSPGHKLDVNGNIGLAASSYVNFGATDGGTGYGIRDNAGVIEIKNSGGSWSSISTGAISGSGTVGYVPKFSSSTGLTSSLLYDNGTNIGIGSSAPGAKLDVASGTANTSGLRLSNLTSAAPTGTGQPIGVDSSGNVITVAAGTASQWSNITGGISYSAGNVGIGTTTPGMPLVVQGVDNYGIMEVVGNGTNYQSAIGLRSKNVAAGSTGAWEIAAAGGTSGNFFVFTAGTGQVITATTGGNVGIDSASPNHTFDVAGNIGLGTSKYINFGATDGSTGYGIRDNAGTIEIKNSGGSWAAPGSGSSQWTTGTGLIYYAAGNVGIGSSSASHALTVTATADNSEGALITTKTTWGPGKDVSLYLGDTSHYLKSVYSSADQWYSYYGIQFASNAGTVMSVGTATSGNVGIGSTSPAHTLDVSGNIGLGTSKYINFGATDGSTGYGIRDNAGTIEYKNSSGSWTSLASGGGSQWTTVTGGINYSGGNVGIGSSAPGRAIDIVASTNAETGIHLTNAQGGSSATANILFDNEFVSSRIGIYSSNYAAPYTNRFAVQTSSYGLNLMASAGDIELYTNGNSASNERMRVTSAGNVGIGSTAPGAKLDIVSGTANTSGLKLSNLTSASPTSTGQAIGVDASGNVVTVASGGGSSQWTSGTGLIYYNGGNVGIGTTAPGASLEVDGSLTYNQTNWTAMRIYQGSSLAGVIQNIFGSLALTDNLQFNGGSWDFINPYNEGTYIWQNAGAISFGVAAAAASPSITVAMTIDNGGNVGLGSSSPSQKLDVAGSVKATSFITTSDQRLKTDIETVHGLEDILKLRGVRFRWIKDGMPEVGLIAQEVEKVFPELVVTDPHSGLKSVKYQGLVAPLIEASKELQGRVRDLEDENKKLRADLDELRRDVQLLKARR